MDEPNEQEQQKEPAATEDAAARSARFSQTAESRADDRREDATARRGGADDRREDATARRGGADDRREDATARRGGADDRREDATKPKGFGADDRREDEKAVFPEMVGEDEELLAMLRAGVHFGHRKSRINPKMLPYVFSVRNNVHIIDLTKTKERLAAALAYLSELRRQGKTILFVGTRPAAQALIRELATTFALPYVTSRWVGGTLTNFAVITKRLEYFRGLEAKQKSGELEKYTKHERHLFEIERRRLEEKFGGIKEMRALPQALFLADLYEDELAAREARRKGIPVVALADTNTDPTLTDYPIPANDDALSSLQYLLGRVKGALEAVTPEPTTP